jgi:tetratricopeptide (TPR) repeat protein
MDAAIADATRGIELDPNLAASYYARGRAYNSTGENDKAQADLVRAIELDANQADYYLWLAEAYYDLTRYAEALENYRQYLSKGGSGEYAQQQITELEQRVGG